MKIKHTLKNETMKLSHFNENHVDGISKSNRVGDIRSGTTHEDGQGAMVI